MISVSVGSTPHESAPDPSPTWYGQLSFLLPPRRIPHFSVHDIIGIEIIDPAGQVTLTPLADALHRLRLERHRVAFSLGFALEGTAGLSFLCTHACILHALG